MESGFALGKRKRPGKVIRRKREDVAEVEAEAEQIESADENHNHNHNLHQTLPQNQNQDAVFKQYFESHFQPLDTVTGAASRPDEEKESDKDEDEKQEQVDVLLHHGPASASSNQEWEGFSDGETTEERPPGAVVVEVIEHSGQYDLGLVAADARRSANFKSFMSAKIPQELSSSTKPGAARNRGKDDDDDDDTDEKSEMLNLKHDLDLQRLLQESHLLDSSSSSATKRQNPGDQRHKAIDLRLQALGCAGSIFQQSKMPIAHRKGIQAKAKAREGQRRKEARENGIVLEKATSSSSPSYSSYSSKSGAKRERGVDSPAVGRFRAGTLTLSRDDIASIQGQGKGQGKKGFKRRR